jgi:transcriptional regulator GlxA family with amidase domain
VKRRSTDVLVVDHPSVARAIQYVRENLAKPFGIETLLQETMTSRRSLELGFKRSLAARPTTSSRASASAERRSC